MKEIIVIGSGRTVGKNAYNEEMLQKIKAAGLSIEDVENLAQTMRKFSEQCKVVAENIAPKIRELSEALNQLDAESKKTKTTNFNCVNPDSRKYKRARR